MSYTPKCFIYGLIDPITREIRYVGQTCLGMKRPTDHSRPWALSQKPSHRTNWIKSLIAKGLKPEIAILESVSEMELNSAEEFWIGYFAFVGARLTNHTSGGDGVRGYRHTDEARQRQSERQRGKVPSEACIAASRAANRGRRMSDEHRAKLSALRRGQALSAETRAKLSAKMKGRKRSPEAIENVKAALAKMDPISRAAMYEKIAAKRRGQKMSPAAVEKIRKANTGRKRSEEVRRKMSAAMRGVPKGPCSDDRRAAISRAKGGRPFMDQNGTVYTTIGQAARATGVGRPLICKVLHGERKQSKGFVFRWLEPEGQLSTCPDQW